MTAKDAMSPGHHSAMLCTALWFPSTMVATRATLQTLRYLTPRRAERRRQIAATGQR